MLNLPAALTTETVIHFIQCYRRLEQMPLEDGFAELRCLTESDNETRSDLLLQQHFRNQWFSKERAFGRFYLNLPHYRQIYLLHHWGIQGAEDSIYLFDSVRNPAFALMEKPPAVVWQLQELVKFFENHGINEQLTPSIRLAILPHDVNKRFGNAANWGDYILSLPDPKSVLSPLLARIS